MKRCSRWVMHAHPLNSCISKPRSYVYCFVISSSASSHTAAWEHDIGVGGGGGRSVSQAHLVQVPLLPETLRPHPADGTGWAEAGGQVGLSAYKSLLPTAFPFMTFFILKGQFTSKSKIHIFPLTCGAAHLSRLLNCKSVLWRWLL